MQAADWAACSVLVSLSLLAAACGGGSKVSSVASLGTASGASTSSPASAGVAGPAPPAGGPGVIFSGVGIAFAACLRSHGEPSVPDPSSRGQLSITGIDPHSPQLQSAEKDCQKFSPSAPPPTASQQTRAQTQALKFAACVRKHGLPNFPDPIFRHGNIGQRGVDPKSPQFQSAQRACASFNAFSG
jgi:hypothetical protein